MKDIKSAQEIVDNCEEKLTNEEIKEVEGKVNKDIEEETKEIVSK